MGSLIDLENIDSNIRCKDVKETIVWMNIIGAPLSFLLLLGSIIRMIYKKKVLSFLSCIIILIFSSEILNAISKMLQLIKYIYEDTRTSKKTNEEETPRGIICQIQIVISIISDFGSLLGTILVSLRCNSVIKKRKDIFDKKKYQILSFAIIIFSSISLSLIFLFIDRSVTSTSLTYKYDIRDRCNYWCWLEHRISIACYICYFVLVIINIIFACKTNSFLKKERMRLRQQSLALCPKDNSLNSNENPQSRTDEVNIPPEYDNRIKELTLIKIKVLIYPWITIIIWALLMIYRLLDDIGMANIDNLDTQGGNDEVDYLEKKPELLIALEIFLILHTLISSIRGIIYSLTFIIFEEKTFWNWFRNCVNCCKFLNLNDSLEEQNGEMFRSSGSSLTGRNTDTSLTEIIKNEANEDNLNCRKSNVSDLGKNNYVMNTSDYNYND